MYAEFSYLLIPSLLKKFRQVFHKRSLKDSWTTLQIGFTLKLAKWVMQKSHLHLCLLSLHKKPFFPVPQSRTTWHHLTYLENAQYSSILKNHSILSKISLGISEFQFMGLLEAGFAIWTMDDFIRRYTGSDESHRTLQLYLGRIWPLQQKEGERSHSWVFDSRWSDMERKIWLWCSKNQRERICSLSFFKGFFSLPKYIFLEASLLLAKETPKAEQLCCIDAFS